MSAAHVAASERARLADQLVEIENSAKRRDREARRLPLDRRIAYFRLRELERIYPRRYGLVLPDDEAGRGDLSIALNHIVFRSGDVLAKMLGWARRWAPWLPEAEARRIAVGITKHPIRWKANTLGLRLRLTRKERTRLGIKTIRAFDMTREEGERAWREGWNASDESGPAPTISPTASPRPNRGRLRASVAGRGSGGGKTNPP